MTRDGGGGPPAPVAGGGGDGGTRRCSQCGHHGHNSRTCTSRGVKLFGVRIAEAPIRKSVSMGNIAHFMGAGGGSPAADGLSPPAAAGGGAAAREDGYASEDLEGTSSRRERKRGEAWTEEEHKKFLLGLNKLGKGDWRGISRTYVVTRTPTQVASHAQKYFIRQSNLQRRKRRSSLFDMVIDEPADLQLPRTSSQELEEKGENPQPAAAPAPTPVLVPVPVPAPQPEEHESIASSSNNGEAVIPRPEAMPPYGYPMMFPPYYPQTFVPVPYYGYVPVFYGQPEIAQASHEVVKPMAVHSKPPLNVEDLYSMSELSLRGESNANNGMSTFPLPPKAIGRSERQSAFHGKGPTDGSSNGLIPAVQ